MDYLAQLFASAAEQLHLRVFYPHLKLGERILLGLFVSPFIVLAIRELDNRIVGAYEFVGMNAITVLVTIAYELAVSWQRTYHARAAQEKIRQLTGKKHG
jgi:hypothetical protein